MYISVWKSSATISQSKTESRRSASKSMYFTIMSLFVQMKRRSISTALLLMSVLNTAPPLVALSQRSRNNAVSGRRSLLDSTKRYLVSAFAGTVHVVQTLCEGRRGIMRELLVLDCSLEEEPLEIVLQDPFSTLSSAPRRRKSTIVNLSRENGSVSHFSRTLLKLDNQTLQ